MSGTEKKFELKDLTDLAVKTTLSVEGVSSMSETLTDTIMNLSGISHGNNGVKISENDGKLSVDLYINAYFHTKIPSLAWDIQSAVKQELEQFSAYKVDRIDIHVQGVDPVNKEENNEENRS